MWRAILFGVVSLAGELVLTAWMWSRGSPVSLLCAACAGVVGVSVWWNVRTLREIPQRSELVEAVFVSLDDGSETPTVVEFYIDGDQAGFRNPDGAPFPARTTLSADAPAWFAPLLMHSEHWREVDDNGE